MKNYIAEFKYFFNFPIILKLREICILTDFHRRIAIAPPVHLAVRFTIEPSIAHDNWKPLYRCWTAIRLLNNESI